MNYYKVFSIFCLIAQTCFSTSCAAQNKLAAGAAWSAEAHYLHYDGETRQLEIASPDRKKKAIIRGATLSVMVGDTSLPGLEDIGISSLAELGWSPNSSALFVTQSYGGAVGEWLVTVYIILDGRVEEINVAGEVVKEFRKQYKCEEPEDPNVGAVKWLTDSKDLLLVAEVPPHSSCPEMGMIKGYIVSIPEGKIIEEIDEVALRAKWGIYLGERFNPK
jgi:hypothetical protein